MLIVGVQKEEKVWETQINTRFRIKVTYRVTGQAKNPLKSRRSVQ